MHVCALACEMAAKSLCRTYPGAVHEPSSRGIGRNVILRLATEGWSATEINERLRHLEAELDSYKMLWGPGVKQIEVKRTDFQIALVVLSVIGVKPNDDHQLPGELVRWVWTRVIRRLGLSRRFDNNRWKAIRDTMSKKQMLNWIDNKYWFSEMETPTTGKASPPSFGPAGGIRLTIWRAACKKWTPFTKR